MSIVDVRADDFVQGSRTAFPARRQSMPVRKKTGTNYLSQVRQFAMLERDQEYRLAKRWREHGDHDAADRLITSHLRLAVKIAMTYRGYGLPVSEIVSEGNVGLMQALYRFEPDRGFRFATYAMWWIRASIQDYILRSWSLVRIGTTASQKRLFFKLRSAKSKIAALQSGDMSPEQVALIAKNFGVADREVIDMNRRLGGDSSLNAPISDEGQTSEWQDYLVDQSPSPEAMVAGQDETDHRRKALIHAVGVLNGRERRIFEARHLADEPRTLEDLATEFKISSERVRQIEMRAFEKVRHAVKQHVAKMPTPAAALRSSRLVASRRDAAPSHSEPVMPDQAAPRQKTLMARPLRSKRQPRATQPMKGEQNAPNSAGNNRNVHAARAAGASR